MHTTIQKAALVLAATIITIPFANAGINCTVNLEDAYQEAQQSGWTFRCEPKGQLALNFDNAKRVGCSGKTGMAGAGSKYTAYFFCKNDPKLATTGFYNGWRMNRYTVTGGQYSVKGYTPGCVVSFDWQVGSPNFRFSRHMETLRLNHPTATHCKDVLSAF